MSLLSFAVKRLLLMIPVLLFLTAVIFILNELSPVDPARAVLGNAASEEQVAELREEMGLNDPLPAQYVDYLKGMLEGDLGTSLRLQQPVTEGLSEAYPNTLELAGIATIITIVFGTLLGLASAGRWRGANVLRAVMVAGASAPTFLLGIAGILIFFSALDWLPASGTTSFQDTAPEGPTGFLLIDSLLAGDFDIFWDAMKHVIMPAIAIALIPAVAVGRTLRSGLITAMSSDYARTARSKGLTERQIAVRHGLRNAVGPALAMLGLQSGLMLSGVVVVELVFAWPGIGLYAAQAIPVADFPVIAGVALVIGATYVIINAIVDVLQAVADPRIRL